MPKKIKLSDFYYVATSKIHGKGLFAKKIINEGDYMGTYKGPQTKENGMHVLWILGDNDEWLGCDGRNILRYINHDTQPCAEFDGTDLYAIRDISIDEEITIHYGDEFENDDS